MTNKALPSTFLMLTETGLSRVTVVNEPIQSIDQVMAKFSSEKQMFVKNVTQTAYGPLHISAWTGSVPRTWIIQELTLGAMILATQYAEIVNEDEEEEKEKEESKHWISPIFTNEAGAFPLRCVFDFGIWARAGLQLYLGLNTANRGGYLWVHYVPGNQIYRPPFGNIFESSCQLCLGHNDAQIRDIFQYGQPLSVGVEKMILLMASSTWNHDTFRPSDRVILPRLVRFNPAETSLPMLEPLNPELITKCSVATNKELVEISKNLKSV